MSFFYNTFDEITGDTRDLIADNTVRAISEQDVRERFYQLAYSYYNLLTGFNIQEFNSGSAYVVGDLVYNGITLYKKIGVDGTYPLTNGTQWSQLSTSPFSRTSKFGLIKLATKTESINGVNNNKAITPSTLRDAILAAVASGVTIQDLTLNDLVDVSGATSGDTNNNEVLYYDAINNYFTVGYAVTTTGDTFLSYDLSTRELSLDTTLFGVTGLTLETFTGSTISDNVSIKTAMQELETALENLAPPTNLSIGTNNNNTLEIESDTGNNVILSGSTTSLAGLMTGDEKQRSINIQTILGVLSGETAYTGFTGDVYVDGENIKENFQKTENVIQNIPTIINFSTDLNTVKSIKGFVGNSIILREVFNPSTIFSGVSYEYRVFGDENTTFTSVASINDLNTAISGFGLTDEFEIRIAVVFQVGITSGALTLNILII